ncbi:MAG: DedA family protein [Desulfosarcinaceae bacterium]
MDVESLLRSTGYPALFVGSVLEGETCLVLASLMAHQGILDLPTVIVVAYLGAVCGDHFFYFLGRLRGRSYIRRRPRWHRKLQRAEDLLQRYHLPLLLSFRFLYGLRGIVPFAVGLSGLTPRRFTLLNAVGALLWAVSVGWGIYRLAGWIHARLPDAGGLKIVSIVITLVMLAGAGLTLGPLGKRRH